MLTGRALEKSVLIQPNTCITVLINFLKVPLKSSQPNLELDFNICVCVCVFVAM